VKAAGCHGTSLFRGQACEFGLCHAPMDCGICPEAERSRGINRAARRVRVDIDLGFSVAVEPEFVVGIRPVQQFLAQRVSEPCSGLPCSASTGKRLLPLVRASIRKYHSSRSPGAGTISSLRGKEYG
jgi:hypothetical protein